MIKKKGGEGGVGQAKIHLASSIHSFLKERLFFKKKKRLKGGLFRFCWAHLKPVLLRFAFLTK